jgi:hypothetical protein
LFYRGCAAFHTVKSIARKGCSGKRRERGVAGRYPLPSVSFRYRPV